MKTKTDFYESLEHLDQHLKRGKHYRVRIVDRLQPVTIIAPHGGYIERGTSHIARALAGSDCNLFDFQGLRQRRPWELHVTSVKFRHPDLVNMLDRSQTAVSVHSMGTESDGRILIGGLNCRLRERVYRELELAGFPVTTEGLRYRGVHPKNIVNLAPEKGVQIELTTAVLKLMFAPQTPRFVADDRNLVTTVYCDRFVAAVRKAIFDGVA